MKKLDKHIIAGIIATFIWFTGLVVLVEHHLSKEKEVKQVILYEVK